MKRNILAEILKRLRDAGWLSQDKAKVDPDELVKEAFDEEDSALMRGAQLMNLIEFGRTVHAEVAALLDAARRGVAVRGGTMYTKTFPCHDCARHIVAAGIRRVVYIEPYPKSLAADLYPDSIAVDRPGAGLDQVKFEPFVGIAPPRYIDLFSWNKRKRAGKAIVWDKLYATPRLQGFPPSYLRNEKEYSDLLYDKMEQKGLNAI